jgi:hypothetical protein
MLKMASRASRYRLLAVSAAATLAVWGSADALAAGERAADRQCDSKMTQRAFGRDDLVTVLVVKEFKKGDPLLLSGTPTPQTPTAQNDVCLVKLVVGPGNPGPTGAPSTSPGIGIEVWLPTPANWNSRVHNLGGGGWAGGSHTSTTVIASTAAASTAGVEGAVSGTTDTGHSGPGGGAFAMNPDGTINRALWNDFADRSLHELAQESKALARAYYGSAPRYSYWEGGSTGGRQGLKEMQAHPRDYDGLIVNYPAINWTKFITGELYPQIVYQRDLAGVPLTSAQQNAMGNAAIAACANVGGQNLGYIPDPSACTYDPRKDASVLCNGVAGIGVTGTNTTTSCVNLAQAVAMNKIWYGQTDDGSVPDPAVDNDWTIDLTGLHRWYGLNRGTSPSGLAGSSPFTISSDQVALELQNPTLATPSFINATGNGNNGWKALTYPQLSSAWYTGVALQPEFAYINTDDPDLRAFERSGGKAITWHGLNDTLIAPQGTINYYNKVIHEMGGSLQRVQDFWKLYLVPGAGHGTPNGTTNASANPPAVAAGQLYALLTAWVENGVAPGRINLTTPANQPVKSRPICVYPQKATYTSGDPNVQTSYSCS